MLHLTDLVLRTAVSGSNLSDTLFNLTRMVNLRLQGVRCSVINVLDQHLGYVVTSSDNICAAGIKLNLIKYPEVLTVANTGHLMAIENIENDINMAKFKPYFQEVDFNSMVVCPLEKNGEIFGVLSLRMPPEKSHVSDNEIRFVEIVSHVISLTLSSQLSNKTKEFWLSAA